MADLTNLTAAVNKLTADLGALKNLVTNTLVPDIQKAIELIQSGDSQGAIDALTASVTAADETVQGIQGSTQDADAALESAENPAPPQQG